MCLNDYCCTSNLSSASAEGTTAVGNIGIYETHEPEFGLRREITRPVDDPSARATLIRPSRSADLSSPRPGPPTRELSPGSPPRFRGPFCLGLMIA
jgi:hypothetical protein